MQRDRWQQVSEIFEAALAVEPEVRGAFVAERCGTDEVLRQEVELLISSHEKAGAEKFIDSPAAERAAPLIALDEEESERPQLQSNQRIGHYTIDQLIGSGGMGEVYRATDTRLDRTVALKILPAEVASDQRRMLRFKQEARAVSALNQPNILTIYEFGSVDDLHFLASEYIDGETLRQRIHTGQMKLPEILDVVIQVCAALDAAHEARIVHRDIKPENIMIRRRDGVVKVLDFGLAKLADKSPPASATDAEADTAVLRTAPGSIMGTFNYMSPEQAQGKRVDQRSDIWSIGVVIYELVSGRAPFTGPTRSHTVVSILENEPVTLHQSAKIGVPPELERIVSKALAKNPDERYQSAKDLLIDLRNLRKHLELESERRRSDPTVARVTDQVTSTVYTEATPKIQTGAAPTHRRKVIPAMMVLALLVVGGVVAASLWRWSNSTSAPPSPVVVERRLNYWIEVQKYREGKPFEAPFTLAREINFERDYRIRLNVRAPNAGYLYVLNDGPEEGEPLSVLFPSPTTNGGSAFLTENKVSSIPETSWFRFDNERGAERVWLVWSPETIPALEAVRRFANTNDQGVINDADLNREALSFIQRNADPKPAVERNPEGKETLVRSNRNIVVHLITLEHN